VSEFIEALARVAVSKWQTRLISFRQKLALVMEAVIRIHDELPEVVEAKQAEEAYRQRRRAASARVLVAHDPARMRRGGGAMSPRKGGRKGSVLGGKALVEEYVPEGGKQDESHAAGDVWRP
jgi:hypothetical protein